VDGRCNKSVVSLVSFSAMVVMRLPISWGRGSSMKLSCQVTVNSLNSVLAHLAYQYLLAKQVLLSLHLSVCVCVLRAETEKNFDWNLMQLNRNVSR